MSEGSLPLTNTSDPNAAATIVATDNHPPYRATIELDLWIYDRFRAHNIMGQILEHLDTLTTNDLGGVSVHHKVTSWTVQSNP